MISGISGSSFLLPTTGDNPAEATRRTAKVKEETNSPFEIAQQILDVKSENLKRTLDAQVQLLDLLA